MSAETVTVRFVTKYPRYAPAQGDFEISSALNRQGLSAALNQIFDSDDQTPFDFKINGHFLRQSLGQALLQHHISPESLVVLEFFPAYQPPSQIDEQTAEAWISSIQLIDSSILYSLYDGTIHLNDSVFKFSDDSPPIKCVAPLGQTHAVAGDIDGCVTIFDLSPELAHAKFSLHHGPIHSIAANPGLEHLFITGGSDSNIQLWSTSQESNALSAFYGHTDSVQAIKWTDRETLVSVSLDRTIRVWDVEKQQAKLILSASNGIFSMDVRENMIVTGHPDRAVRLWDMRVEERHSVIREFKSHKNWVSGLQWHDGEVFASASYDGSVKLWNIGTEVPLSTLFQHEDKVLALAVNDEVLVAGGSDQILRVFRFAEQIQ
jgi:ribosome biogenesis protein YTM1